MSNRQTAEDIVYLYAPGRPLDGGGIEPKYERLIRAIELELNRRDNEQVANN